MDCNHWSYRLFLDCLSHVPILKRNEKLTIAGWWFATFFIFPYIGSNHPKWLIFFRGGETTNQLGSMGHPSHLWQGGKLIRPRRMDSTRWKPFTQQNTQGTPHWDPAYLAGSTLHLCCRWYSPFCTFDFVLCRSYLIICYIQQSTLPKEKRIKKAKKTWWFRGRQSIHMIPHLLYATVYDRTSFQRVKKTIRWIVYGMRLIQISILKSKFSVVGR